MACAPNEYIGASGSRYRFKELLQERPSMGRVWLAKCGQDQFVLKDIPKDIFDNFHEKIWPQLQQCSFIRLPCDTIPGQRIFVYRYLTSDFLNLVKEGLPPGARKRILRPSLQGIAEFHGRDVAHLDIKPDISWLNASPVVKIPRLNGFRSSTLRMPLTFPKADASKVCLRAMTIGEVLRRTSKASLISQRTFSHLGLSASTLCSGGSSSVLMRILENIRLRVHCLLSFACNVKCRTLDTRRESTPF